jgi:release factor glutamine methyltransferase
MPAPIETLLSSLTARLQPGSESPRLDAQVLLSHVTGRPRTWLLAHSRAPVEPSQVERLEALARRLEAGEPLAYVVGHKEFFGLDFELTRDVLIPRPETELLVERAVAWLRATPGRRRVADVGTGCGCIAISVAANVGDVRVFATDISLAALRVAARNARALALTDRIDLVNCDLLPVHQAGLNGRRRFDLVCANLPYIPTSRLHQLRVYGREPLRALDGGPDGLEQIRKLLAVVPEWLAPGGLILLEIESSQGPLALSLAYDAFHAASIELRQDLAGHDRVLAIHLPEE